MGKRKITEVVTELAGDFLKEHGYELYNTEFVKEGRDWFLRVYIDKVQPAENDEAAAAADAADETVKTETVEAEAAEAQYISTEDCELVSRYLSEKLDEADPIEQNYYLEVSSPGLDRPLLKPEHYERYTGEEIEIRLYKALDGVKNIQGVLEAFAPETETVTVRSQEWTKKGGSTEKVYELKLADIAKANLAVIF